MANLSSYVIIGAGGKGERMGCNKQLLELDGKPVVVRSIEAFENHPLIDGIIVVRPAELKKEFDSLFNKYMFSKLRDVADSGKERQYSMYNGLMKVPNCSVVLFHNGANPLVTEREITECVKEAYNNGAAVVANPVKDTIKRVDKDGNIIQTLIRSELWAMQTPQAIRYDIAMKAYSYIIENNIVCTDDVQAVELYSKEIPIKIVKASPQNIKLTTPLDVKIALSFLKGNDSPVFDLVYGIGEDSHEFDETIKVEDEVIERKNNSLVIGGVVISSEMSFKANSDGDVVLHAISRAISSSVGGPQLDYFADELAKKGVIDSKIYLRSVVDYAKEKGYAVNDVRIVIEAGKPRLSYHLEKIRKSLSELLSIPEERVGLAVHSGEKLSLFGHGKGVKAFAFVSMKKI